MSGAEVYAVLPLDEEHLDRQNRSCAALVGGNMWEFPKIRGTLFWGPYKKDPTV